MGIGNSCGKVYLEAAYEPPGAEVEQPADAVQGARRDQGPVRGHRQRVDLAAAAGDGLSRPAARDGGYGLEGCGQPLLARCRALLNEEACRGNMGIAEIGSNDTIAAR